MRSVECGMKHPSAYVRLRRDTKKFQKLSMSKIVPNAGIARIGTAKKGFRWPVKSRRHVNGCRIIKTRVSTKRNHTWSQWITPPSLDFGATSCPRYGTARPSGRVKPVRASRREEFDQVWPSLTKFGQYVDATNCPDRRHQKPPVTNSQQMAHFSRSRAGKEVL